MTDNTFSDRFDAVSGAIADLRSAPEVGQDVLIFIDRWEKGEFEGKVFYEIHLSPEGSEMAYPYHISQNENGEFYYQAEP